MAIIRGGSWTAVITLPEAPSNYTVIKVTMSQNQNLIYAFSNANEEIVIDEDNIAVQLSQEQTAAFLPTEESPMGRRVGDLVYVQARCYKSTYDAPASRTWPVKVYDSNETEVLS